MAKPGRTGFIRIYHAFIYSMQGFSHAWRHEAAFRQEVSLAAIMLPGSFFLAQDHIELILLITTVALVLMAELTNSAIEAAIDRMSHEYHELSGRAKDFGSALVLVAMIICATTWGIIAYNRFG